MQPFLIWHEGHNSDQNEEEKRPTLLTRESYKVSLKQPRPPLGVVKNLRPVSHPADEVLGNG